MALSTFKFPHTTADRHQVSFVFRQKNGDIETRHLNLFSCLQIGVGMIPHNLHILTWLILPVVICSSQSAFILSSCHRVVART